MPIQLLHRLVFWGFQCQIAVILVTFQKTPALQKLRHPSAYPVPQHPQFFRRGRLDVVKGNLPVSVLRIGTVEVKHVKM